MFVVDVAVNDEDLFDLALERKIEFRQ